MLLVLIKMPLGRASNNYPQHMFLWRNEKDYPTFYGVQS